MRSKNLDVRLILINESVWCIISGCPRHLSPPTTVSRLHLGIKAVSLMFRHVDYLIISGENPIKIHPLFHNFTNKPYSELHLNLRKQTKVSSPEVICMMTTIMWNVKDFNALDSLSYCKVAAVGSGKMDNTLMHMPCSALQETVEV